MTDADDVVGDCFDWCGGGQGGIHWMKKNSNPKFAALKQETDAVIYIYIYILTLAQDTQ